MNPRVKFTNNFKEKHDSRFKWCTNIGQEEWFFREKLTNSSGRQKQKLFYSKKKW